MRFQPAAKRFYERKRARTNAIVAIRALAHKLARATYFMLRTRRPTIQRCCFDDLRLGPLNQKVLDTKPIPLNGGGPSRSDSSFRLRPRREPIKVLDPHANAGNHSTVMHPMDAVRNHGFSGATMARGRESSTTPMP